MTVAGTFQIISRAGVNHPICGEHSPDPQTGGCPVFQVLVFVMWIVAIAWMFVAVLMAIAEATSPIGTVLGAFFTLLLYGIFPVSIVMYILLTPQRRRARLAAARREAEQAAQAAQTSQTAQAAPPVGDALPSAGHQPDAGSLPPGDGVASERKEP
jgi:hypothetical protein